jgi:hypothetical protein
MWKRPTLTVVCALLVNGCFRSCDCDDVVYVRKVSPSGKMQAALMIPECGATVGYETYLIVDKAGRRPHDDPEKRAVSIKGAQPDLSFSWKDDRTVVVTLGGQLIEMRNKVGAVNMVYEDPR